MAKAALTRREFTRATLLSLCSPVVSGCSGGGAAYDAVLAEMTQPLAAVPNFADLVRYAALAANGHNTQPWKFLSRNGAAIILPDFARRTPIVDPDDHHLFASLGCAAENMSQAARARGMSGEVRFEDEAGGSLHVDLAPGARDETKLFAAIPVRQCSRAPYDGKPVSSDILRRLEAAAKVHGVEPMFVFEPRLVEDVLALVIEGNSRQLDTPAFVAELKRWIRFNGNAAADMRDGLYSASTGNPTLPPWVGSIMFDLSFSKRAENDKYTEQVRSSSGIVVFVAGSNDKQGWASAGRAYQRFALQATVDGLKHAFINQAVEVPEMRGDLQALLGLGDRRPNLVVRFGYGREMPKSLRRKTDDVIVAQGA